MLDFLIGFFFLAAVFFALLAFASFGNKDVTHEYFPPKPSGLDRVPQRDTLPRRD